MDVSYVLAVTHIEPIDSAQLVIARYVSTASGLFMPIATDPTFVVANLTGKPKDRGMMLSGAQTVFGFIIPSEDAVAFYRDEPAGYRYEATLAGNPDQLVDSVISSLDQMRSSIRSLDGYDLSVGPYGDPCPDPVAAALVIRACRGWAGETGEDIDEELAWLLGGDEE